MPNTGAPKMCATTLLNWLTFGQETAHFLYMTYH